MLSCTCFVPKSAPSTPSRRCGRTDEPARCGRARPALGSGMRVVIAAVGRLKPGAERELAEAYRVRAAATGRALGLGGIEIVEVRESRARAAERRVVEETIALANLIADGAVIAVLD